MAEPESTQISETPRGTVNTSGRASHDSYDGMDSGYLSLTPHSGGFTSIVAGCRTRTSLASSKRHYRMRTDPWQSDRAPRLRSKLNHRLNSASENTCDSLVDESQEAHSGVSQDSGNFSCEDRMSSVDRSTSSEGQSLHSDMRDYGAELRERRNRGRRAWRSAAPITPASRLHLLSPPPSPAVPSSSFVASEPIEEDVEMKLVIVPQSTPYTNNSPKCKTLIDGSLNFSPTTSRTSPPAITSVDNKKLSDLMITDLSSIAEIKPKRLDFSQRGYALHRTRATPDFTGKETVDLLSLLGEKSNHWRVVSKIFLHLSPQDLCSVSMVSKAWRRICTNDSRANMRRLSHIMLRQNTKENLKLIRKAKAEAAVQMSPKSRFGRKGYLLEVQNLLQVPPTPRPPNSPPVSPSKVKFHSFVKVSSPPINLGKHTQIKNYEKKT